ncbi:cytochrome P450 [Mycena capillaripes]|nr:cytochrome P450 [Mycena capillaripes]
MHFNTDATYPPLLFVDNALRLNTFSFATGAMIIIAAFYFLYTSFFGPTLLDKDGNGIPAGPKGLPLLGGYCSNLYHFLDLMILGSFPFLTQYPELTLDRWAKQFGDLYAVWLGNQLFVIVSSPAIVKDLIVTNGAVFSSRKEMFIKSQTILVGRGITATPYNDRWRKHRRIAKTWLTQRAVDSYTDVLDEEATVLVKAMYQESKGGMVPINPQPHAGRASLNNMLSIVFGLRTDSIYHRWVGQALKLSREFMQVSGRWVVSPSDKIIPTAIRSRGQKLHNDLVNTYGGFIKDIEHRMQMGSPVPDCLVKTMLDVKEKEELDHLDLAILASAFMIGGVETMHHPVVFRPHSGVPREIQKKAHEELDRVVGRDRLPTVEDEKNLPYCHAIVKEVERCHNPFWLGTPHVASEDFTYKGQFIPKDTVVVLNTWTMHHDQFRHPEPERFNPERYLHDDFTSAESANLADPYQRDHWMFGAGRRICPGMIVAEREIWLTISRMLWAFTMVSLPNQPIDLKEYDGLSGRSPVPFRINIFPRHPKVAEVLGIEETLA